MCDALKAPENGKRMTLVHRGPPAEPMKNMSVGCPQAMIVPATPGCQTAQRAAAAEAENERLREALQQIACFGDYNAEMKLSRTGSFASFDEPCSVQIARAALQEAPRDA